MSFEDWYGKLCAAFPHDFTWSETQVELWRGTFRHRDDVQMSAAVSGWIAQHRKPPTVADVFERLKLNTNTQTGSYYRSCGSCDHGWDWTDKDSVRRCSNGCLPPVKGTPDRDDFVPARRPAA